MTSLLCRPLIFIAWLFGQRQERHIKRANAVRAWQTALDDEQRQP